MTKRFNHFSVFMIIFTLSNLMLACSDQTSLNKTKTNTYQVQPEHVHQTLYFTGTIQPLRVSTLTNPMDAVIESMHYQYGQSVKKNELVFTLNSSELQKQYNDTLMDYLKAKDTYTITQAKFVGTEDLWRAGLLSKNTYLSEKSSLNTTRLTLMQTRRKLSEMLEKMGENSSQNLSTLSFSEFDKVRQALTSKHNLIYLTAPNPGLLLYPPKSADEKTGRLTVGSLVKAGQVLALIGDISGIRVEIDVPEVDIDKIKLGMPAIVRSIAFPNDEMEGKLVAINAQASSSNSGSLPSFTAIVEVKKLTLRQASWIKVGMSASIELPVDNRDKLLIPIAAIKQENGQSLVQVRETDGSVQSRVVTTGAAQADKVEINSGLNPGDLIVYA